jgi:SSS family solute:Na+ symporter
VNLYLAVLLVYALGLMVLGLRLGRNIKRSGDFFVAGRTLGPGLIFSTMLAANIGAGSTVGATGLGYAGGVAAWWWVGSAAIGSFILAWWIGPIMRRLAAAHDLRTVGDYLEFRYDRRVRAAIAVLIWLGSIFILASQLIAIGWILNVVTGMSRSTGCVIGGAVVTAYFAAGGLLTSAWVNVVQLTVKLGGFALAVPLALAAAGGWSGVATIRPDDAVYWSFWRGGPPGVAYLALLVPAFIISPGLLQKIFGARDDRAVRIGVGLNALGLLIYAGVPALLGMIARSRFPDLASSDLALPMILMHGLPATVGAIGLAAVFSAELSAADAVLFMLATSLSQDLYKRFLNPEVSDLRLLQVARWTSVGAGTLAVVLAIVSGNVINTLTIFYALLAVSLFVPVLAGLYGPRTTPGAALASIGAGVVVLLALQVTTGGAGFGIVTPALAGLMAAVMAWAVAIAAIPSVVQS